MTVGPFPVIGMNELITIKSLPPLFETKTEVIEHDAVGVNAFTVRLEYRNMLRHEVQHLPKPCFLFANFLFGEFRCRNVRNRTNKLEVAGGIVKRVSDDVDVFD